MLAQVFYVFDLAKRQPWVDKVGVTLDEAAPLKVLGHGDGTVAKLLDGIVRVITLALEDTGEGVVSLLDLTNNNGFELTARSLEIEIGLS